MPEKARAHLFQAFQGSARKGGTGLGLAVAQELVTAHGGTIRLRDTDQRRRLRDRDSRSQHLTRLLYPRIQLSHWRRAMNRRI